MILYELDEAQKAWLASRPPVVQKMFRQIPGNRLYRLKDTGHRCTIFSYCEDGTVSVDITWDFNDNLVFERQVFGISLDNLEECDPICGPLRPPVLNTEEEIQEYLEVCRQMEEDAFDERTH